MANTNPETASLRDFLRQLDDSDKVEVTDWEAGFIESNLDRESFSYDQRERIVKLILKYGTRIGYC